MDGRTRHGRPEEELFMQSSSNNAPETPTVGPLKINKAASPPPGQQAAQSSQSASISAPIALPYPIEAASATSGPLSYTPPAFHDTPSFSSPPRNPGASSRTKFNAHDPHRPSVSGYGLSPYNGMAAPKPLPESPGPDTPDKDGYWPPSSHDSVPGAQPVAPPPSSYAAYSQQSFPAPGPPPTIALPTPNSLKVPKGGSAVNRLDSSASVSTTRAHRGSPPPPETPQTEPGGGIEARYAAAGIAGPNTLNSLQAQKLVAASRQNQENTAAPAAQPGEPVRRPWTPTESSAAATQGPQYQGGQLLSGSQLPSAANDPQPNQSSPPRRANVLESDFQGLQVSDEPPPAYSSVLPPTQGYPAEKTNAPTGAGIAGATAAATMAGAASASTQQGHPAFSNDANRFEQPQEAIASPQPQSASTVQQAQPGMSPAATTSAGPSPAPGPAAPPPLPEGWIAHLDPNSGQYYYIHLPTQATQWEFPKGPTPLNLDNPPTSPTGTIHTQPISPISAKYGAMSMASPGFVSPGFASPGFPPQHAEYRQSVLSMTTLASPTGTTYGLPPGSGIEVYKVAPTNGVYFGPYLRYTNLDLENGVWYGSILLVTEVPQPPTVHIHQSVDLSPNPRQLKANPIYQHQRWTFYRYDIDLKMEEDHDAKWTYAITSHLGCTRYEFTVAGRYERSWRFLAHSGNDFALNVSAADRSKLGGVGLMWKDILQKHQEVDGFHAQLGVGNQIYADRLWKELPILRQWTQMSGKENRKNAPWTARHEEDVAHAFFHYYSSHFDQDYVREAFAQIPHVLALDDHDIFDGFGSYPEYMQFSAMFKNIGRIGIEMYLLFQHHTTLEILRNVHTDFDLFTITGTGWHFIKYLGPSVVVVAPDTRSERNPHQVMAGPTYQGLFPKVAVLPTNVQHCIWMLPVPVVYPRLDTAEHIANTVATGKRAVTGTFNAVGKVAGSVAGIVGAKGVVGEGFNSVKKAIGKSGLMSNVLSPFGELDVMDEVRDQWTHESKDLERTYLIRTLQGIAHNKSLRMTFLSGATNCCGAGILHDPGHPSDHKTMYQIVSSSVVNAPPPGYVLKMMSSSSNKPLYVPLNGQRSTPNPATPTDTKEDMLEMFGTDITGQPREMKRLMERRNYAVFVSYDPDLIGQGGIGQGPKGPGVGGNKISLAVDFLVQGDVAAQYHAVSTTVKYGPVVIPCVDLGR